MEDADGRIYAGAERVTACGCSTGPRDCDKDRCRGRAILVEVVAEFPEELMIAFGDSGVADLIGGIAREF